MVPIARRNLLSEKLRLAIAIGGVAFAVFLIVTIQSLYYGFRSGAGEFARQFPAALWVVQPGIGDLARSSSQIPSSLQPEVAQISGVAAAVRAEGRLQRISVDGREDLSFVIAFEDGPATAQAYQALGYAQPPGRGEIIAHDSIARSGQTVNLSGQELRVVDTYGGGIPMAGHSFMNYADAQEAFGISGYVNYVVVFLPSEQDPQQVAASIRAAHPEVDVLTGDQLVEFTGREVDSFLPVIGVLLAIAFLVGAAVVSLIIYTATVEKSRDYAVLKALGASNARLYLVVLSQSFIVSAAGFVLGTPLSFLVASVVRRRVPEFLTQTEWTSVAVVLAAIVSMSLIAAYVPVSRIARIDPATVFRA
jgi:ABC-type transport system, involved in lipoprotein release, permease component